MGQALGSMGAAGEAGEVMKEEIGGDGGGEVGDDENACAICLDAVVASGGERSTARLQCGHEFHLDCIGSAFNVKGLMQCPYCRRIENGSWLYANVSRSSQDVNMDEWVRDEELSDDSYSEMTQYEEDTRNTYGVHYRTVNPDFDPVVMYQSTGGRPHGGFAIEDSAIEPSVVSSARSQRPRASQRHHDVQFDHFQREYEEFRARISAENEEFRARISAVERMMQVMAERQGIDYREFIYQPPDQGT